MVNIGSKGGGSTIQTNIMFGLAYWSFGRSFAGGCYSWSGTFNRLMG